MTNMNILLSEVKIAEAEHLMEQSSKKYIAIKNAFGAISLLLSLNTVLDIDNQHQSDLIDYCIQSIRGDFQKHVKDSIDKGVHQMDTQKQNNVIQMKNVLNNLRANPFYKPSNPELLKNVKIKGHLQSEVPYIPIKSLSIKNPQLLIGDERV